MTFLTGVNSNNECRQSVCLYSIVLSQFVCLYVRIESVCLLVCTVLSQFCLFVCTSKVVEVKN